MGWQESLIGKKILLWCEQGIGDAINWSSCLPLLSSQADFCVFECQKKMVPLLKRSFPNIEIKPENRDLDIERNDFDFLTNGKSLQELSKRNQTKF